MAVTFRQYTQPVSFTGTVNHFNDSSKSFIVSDRIYGQPAYDANESLAQSIEASAFWERLNVSMSTYMVLHEYVKQTLWTNEIFFLRDGLREINTGTLRSEPMYQFPEKAGENIVSVSSGRLSTFDDITARVKCLGTVHVDQVWTRYNEATITPSIYRQFANHALFEMGRAVARDYNLFAQLYFIACLGFYTTSLSFDIQMFFKDMSKLQGHDFAGSFKRYYDKTKSHIWKHAKDLIFPEVKEKRHNYRVVPVELYAQFRDEIELEDPKIKLDSITPEIMKNIYAQKDETKNKMIYRKGINPYTCYLALSKALKSFIGYATNTETVVTSFAYKPYKEADRDENDYQLAKIYPANSLMVALNPITYRNLKERIKPTSNQGNIVAEIDSLEAMGVEFHQFEVIPEGHAVVQSKKAFETIQILFQYFWENYPFRIARKDGIHYAVTHAIWKFVCGCVFIPTIWVPENEFRQAYGRYINKP